MAIRGTTLNLIKPYLLIEKNESKRGICQVTVYINDLVKITTENSLIYLIFGQKIYSEIPLKLRNINGCAGEKFNKNLIHNNYTSIMKKIYI